MANEFVNKMIRNVSNLIRPLIKSIFSFFEIATSIKPFFRNDSKNCKKIQIASYLNNFELVFCVILEFGFVFIVFILMKPFCKSLK